MCVKNILLISTTCTELAIINGYTESVFFSENALKKFAFMSAVLSLLRFIRIAIKLEIREIREASRKLKTVRKIK